MSMTDTSDCLEPKNALPPLMVVIQDLQRRVEELEAKVYPRHSHHPTWTQGTAINKPQEFVKRTRQDVLDLLIKYQVHAPEQLLLDLDEKS